MTLSAIVAVLPIVKSATMDTIAIHHLGVSFVASFFLDAFHVVLQNVLIVNQTIFCKRKNVPNAKMFL